MADIVYIGPQGRGVITPKGEVLQDAVDILKGLLEEAESGKIAAIAVAVVHEGSERGTSREVAWKGGTFADLYVATDQLMRRMHTLIDEA